MATTSGTGENEVDAEENVCFLCPNKGVAYPGVLFHSFPEKEQTRLRWLKFAGIWEAEPGMKICCDHFTLNDYTVKNGTELILKRAAVPRVPYLTNENSMQGVDRRVLRIALQTSFERRQQRAQEELQQQQLEKDKVVVQCEEEKKNPQQEDQQPRRSVKTTDSDPISDEPKIKRRKSQLSNKLTEKFQLKECSVVLDKQPLPQKAIIYFVNDDSPEEISAKLSARNWRSQTASPPAVLSNPSSPVPSIKSASATSPSTDVPKPSCARKILPSPTCSEVKKAKSGKRTSPIIPCHGKTIPLKSDSCQPGKTSHRRPKKIFRGTNRRSKSVCGDRYKVERVASREVKELLLEKDLVLGREVLQPRMCKTKTRPCEKRKFELRSRTSPNAIKARESCQESPVGFRGWSPQEVQETPPSLPTPPHSSSINHGEKGDKSLVKARESSRICQESPVGFSRSEPERSASCLGLARGRNAVRNIEKAIGTNENSKGELGDCNGEREDFEKQKSDFGRKRRSLEEQSETTEKQCESPEKRGGSFDKLNGSSLMESESPEELKGIPEQLNGSPEELKGNSEELKGSPERQTGTSPMIKNGSDQVLETALIPSSEKTVEEAFLPENISEDSSKMTEKDTETVEEDNEPVEVIEIADEVPEGAENRETPEKLPIEMNQSSAMVENTPEKLAVESETLTEVLTIEESTTEKSTAKMSEQFSRSPPKLLKNDEISDREQQNSCEMRNCLSPKLSPVLEKSPRPVAKRPPRLLTIDEIPCNENGIQENSTENSAAGSQEGIAEENPKTKEVEEHLNDAIEQNCKGEVQEPVPKQNGKGKRTSVKRVKKKRRKKILVKRKITKCRDRRIIKKPTKVSEKTEEAVAIMEIAVAPLKKSNMSNSNNNTEFLKEQLFCCTSTVLLPGEIFEQKCSEITKVPEDIQMTEEDKPTEWEEPEKEIPNEENIVSREKLEDEALPKSCAEKSCAEKFFKDQGTMTELCCENASDMMALAKSDETDREIERLRQENFLLNRVLIQTKEISSLRGQNTGLRNRIIKLQHQLALSAAEVNKLRAENETLINSTEILFE